MPTDVIMPQMGESIFEGTITKWLKQAGDHVEKDEPLFEISTDKVDAEIPSPIAGILSEIKIPEGATVQVNTVVAVIGGAIEKPIPAPKAQSPAPEVPAKPQVGRSDGTEIVMPQMGESIFEGTITKWLKQAGDHVEKDEPLFEISTDKVDAEIPSPIAGILTEIKIPEGATVQVNTVVAVIGGAIEKPIPAPKAQSLAPEVPARRRSWPHSRRRVPTAGGHRSRRTKALLASRPPHRQRTQHRPAARPRHRLRRPHHQRRHPPPPEPAWPRH